MKLDRSGSANGTEGVPATGVASTPSSFGAVASSEALAELEFSAALASVATHAVSDLGVKRVLSRVPSSSLEWIERELALVEEMSALINDGDEFCPEQVDDIFEAIDSLELEGSVLEPEGLISVGGALGAMHRVRDGLLRIAPDAPQISALAVEIPPERLARAIGSALEPDGTVRDDASKQLATARRRIRETRSRLQSLLQKTIKGVGSDASGDVTVRNGRYVIPLRRDARSGVRGIVHGESGSGATLFVEPSEAVELGNELNGWEAEETRAVIAVLRDLTENLRPFTTALRDGLEMCIAVDDVYARARYATENKGTTPSVSADNSCFNIVSGKHPLLLSDELQPIPFDLGLGADEFTLLVSGPNAGGKTVFLKTVGLVCALTQSGVVPPVGKGTLLPVFERIFVDIGDHQSIAASLSTFSAHMSALKQVLQLADERSLVLLDELGGGTDPAEGTALAGAVLRSLNERRSVTLATTHLGGLKELASGTPGMANSSFHFDLETLAPTYRFIKDRPGRSYGLAIAQKLGMPGDVLDVANELLPEAARSLDSILADLEAREDEIQKREEAATLAESQLESERASVLERSESLAARETDIADREIELEKEGRQNARKYLLDARRRVEEALGIASQTVTEAKAKQARRLVEAGVSEEGEALKRLEERAQKLGWKVKSGERGAGSGKDSSPSVSPAASHSSLPSVESFELATESASSDIDLRGRTGDEAEAELILALDGAVAGDLPWLRIIHGKGTGALRARVAEVLELDSRVSSFRLASPNQGGSGVTIAEFRK